MVFRACYYTGMTTILSPTVVPAGPWCSLRTVARIYSVHPRSVRRWLECGLVPMRYIHATDCPRLCYRDVVTLLAHRTRWPSWAPTVGLAVADPDWSAGEVQRRYLRRWDRDRRAAAFSGLRTVNRQLAAFYLDCSARTIDRRRCDGSLAAEGAPGRCGHALYRLADLDALVIS